MSIRRTLLPFRARPAASEIAVDVLPTPPFWDAIDTIIVQSALENSRLEEYPQLLWSFSSRIREQAVFVKGVNCRSVCDIPRVPFRQSPIGAQCPQHLRVNDCCLLCNDALL